MRYHIDTIPVWDAVKLDGECFLCALRRKVELGEAERYLGASVMEPNVRIRVNERGFCRKHHAMLYALENRLGHALMLESHMIETRKQLRASLENIGKAADAAANASVGDRLSGKAKAAKDAVRDYAERLSDSASRCILCDTLEENMNRYLHTFFHLYLNDTEFRNRFIQSKGVCLPHTGELIRMAVDELSGKDLAAFMHTLSELETHNMDRIQEEISWFIKKFDYRYEKEDWKTSRDAVERTSNKLRGWCIGKEPNPEK